MLDVNALAFEPYECSLTEEEYQFLEEELFYTYEELFDIEEEEEEEELYTDKENEFLEKAHKEANLIVRLLNEADTVWYSYKKAKEAHIKAANAVIAAKTARTGTKNN
jgi:hypothetical protein